MSDSHQADSWNGGSFHHEKAWAAFHIEELPQVVEADWRANDRPVVVELSMGGFLAMSCATRHPDSSGAVVACGGGFDPFGSYRFRDYDRWGDELDHRAILQAYDP